MKSIILFVLASCLWNTKLFSQLPNFNHPTIEKTEVSYKPILQTESGQTIGGEFDIKVLPQATIWLKPNDSISKIYLKIKNIQNGTELYSVNYLLDSNVVTNDLGLILFSKDGNIIYIKSPGILSLKPYVYELYTEDIQGHSSILYSSIQ